MRQWVHMETIALSRDRRALERRRRAAGRLFDQGKIQAEVARRFRVSTAAACQWHAMWQKGADHLASQGPPGIDPKLSKEKKRRFKRLILKGARSSGYDTDFWTLSRLKQTASRKLRVQIGQTSVWRVLIALGFSCQKPSLRARERDEDAIADWKLIRFPRLKKMG